MQRSGVATQTHHSSIPRGSNDPMITVNKCHNSPGEMPENHPAIGKKRGTIYHAPSLLMVSGYHWNVSGPTSR
jgi:hypothetical protein